MKREKDKRKGERGSKMKQKCNVKKKGDNKEVEIKMP